MTDARGGNFEKYLLILAALVFIGFGALRASYPHNDFVPVYAGARCLLYGCNPYNGTWLVYPPSILVAIFPVALFSFRTGWMLWFVLSAGMYILGVHLVLALCPPERRRLATMLGAIILAGSSQLLGQAQPSTLAIALAAIGGSCLIRGRKLRAGTVALALSLAIKPQIAGLLVIYWAVRSPHRRHAIAAIVGSLGLLVCGILIIHSRPNGVHWADSFRANLADAEGPGGLADAKAATNATALLNLQTITSVFSQTSKIYNSAAYVIFGILLAAWLATEVRSMRQNAASRHDLMLLSTAALSVLTLFPVYHRSYDSRLLLLAIPAALIVLERRRVEGILLCVLIASSAVSFQHWLRLGLEHAGLLDRILKDRILVIVLLNEIELRLLVCFGLLLLAAVRLSVGSRVEFSRDNAQLNGIST